MREVQLSAENIGLNQNKHQKKLLLGLAQKENIKESSPAVPLFPNLKICIGNIHFSKSLNWKDIPRSKAA
jgi:hypothetical protein